ncbi:MAG: EAL domain-containing protein [Methylomonas sp.]
MNPALSALQRVQMALEPTLSGKVGHYGGVTLQSAFQPIINLLNCRPMGYEALVRARRRDGSVISPPELFRQVENEEELVYLDRLCRALHVCNFVNASEPDGLIFLNVNPVVSIRGRYFGNFFDEFLAQVGLSPERVVIEILENSVLDDRQLADSIAFYRDRGCLVAIDDFGAGHSNFRRIWQIKPNIVKMDRSTLIFARSDLIARRVLPSLVNILHEAGCLVVMEGIEDEFEASLALECGADLVQGYYFARPSAFPDAGPATISCRELLERHDRQVRASSPLTDYGGNVLMA